MADILVVKFSNPCNNRCILFQNAREACDSSSRVDINETHIYTIKHKHGIVEKDMRRIGR